MGEMVRPEFGRKRPLLTGFIPKEIGAEAKLYREQQMRARDLVLHAKSGGPIIPPIEDNAPDNCA